MNKKKHSVIIIVVCIFLIVIQTPLILSQELQEDIWQTNASVSNLVKDGTTLYMGGNFTVIGPASPNFTALDLNTAEPELGFPPVQGGIIRAMVSDGAGGWYIAGEFTQVGDSSRSRLAHILADKSIGSWNPGADGWVAEISLSNGIIYVGGAFQTIGGQTHNAIAAIDVNGNVTSWDPQVAPGWVVNAIAISDTIIYFGGGFTTVGGQTRNRLAAVGMSGSLLAWNPNADDQVNSMAIRDTVVYVGGKFGNINGQPRMRCAAIGFSGNLIANWIANSNAGNTIRVYAISIYDTTIYLGGTFTSINGIGATRLAAMGVSGTLLEWFPVVSSPSGGVVSAIKRSGNVVYFGGDFTEVNSSPAEALAAVDATSGLLVNWFPGVSLAPVTPATTIRALEISGTNLYAGGDFIITGGKKRERLAAIDLTTNTLLPWSVSIPTGSVYQLQLRNGVLYVGGNFTTVNGTARSRLAALDASTGNLLSWNPDANNTVTALTIADTVIYIGGNFTTVSGQTRTRLAAIGVAGTLLEWAPTAGSNVATIAVRDTIIYIGGGFTDISGQTRNRLAAIGKSGALLDWNPNSSGNVNTIVIYDTTLYVGGAFNTMSGQARSHLAAIGISGTLLPWTLDASSTVNELFIEDENPYTDNLYIGGNFTTLGGLSRTRLGSVDLGTGAVTGWDPSADGSVGAFKPYNGLVYIGGSFNSVNSKVRYYFGAVTDPSIIPVELFNFSVQVIDNNVELKWTTSTEVNNEGFEVQRNQKTEVRSQNWETIAYIPGYGTTTEPKEYSFLDKNILTGTYTYRLKQIDYDGTFEYSDEIEVLVDFIPGDYALFQNYPNPFNPSTNIKYSLPFASKVKIMIYNMLGETVTELVNAIQESGFYETNWNAENAASGIYFYSINAEAVDGSKNYTLVKKMSLIK